MVKALSVGLLDLVWEETVTLWTMGKEQEVCFFLVRELWLGRDKGFCLEDKQPSLPGEDDFSFHLQKELLGLGDS